ncbi:DUF5667 domain-containing protein [Streptomyces meridianus]|uniref:DUF5667 domain-containing protein n=1 Tax=Streptomyces meridianus TaxID=2938945 RepID=A0ABT0X6X6_9ACTN|nr:DUF5667 domain-containing protein [Streptomyces meridianus]MCM2578274.1 DUF5667 domain-containing protein [Streptomyces meridianus]
MIANVSAHRRANAFADALDEQQRQARQAVQPDPTTECAENGTPATDDPGRRRGAGNGPRDDRAALVALTERLGDLPKPELDAGTRTVQRAQLVAAMESMLAERDSGDRPVPGRRSGKGTHRAGALHRLQLRSRWSKGIAAGGLTVGVAAGAFSGIAAASTDALPGDSLYGLKRGMEDLSLGMADGETDRGRIHLDHASTRLHEARRLMERDRSGGLDHESVTELRRVLSRMSQDASEGHRLLHSAYRRNGSLAPMRTLSNFSAGHRSGWQELRHRLPAQLSDVGDQVTSVFDAMDDEVGPLQSRLAEPPGDDAHGTPSSGSTASRPGTTSDDPSGSGSPRPSESQRDGLVGGAGDILEPPASGNASPSESATTGRPEPDITLPPILPGLLPGLGVDDDRP